MMPVNVEPIWWMQPEWLMVLSALATLVVIFVQAIAQTIVFVHHMHSQKIAAESLQRLTANNPYRPYVTITTVGMDAKPAQIKESNTTETLWILRVGITNIGPIPAQVEYSSWRVMRDGWEIPPVQTALMIDKPEQQQAILAPEVEFNFYAALGRYDKDVQVMSRDGKTPGTSIEFTVELRYRGVDDQKVYQTKATYAYRWENHTFLPIGCTMT